MQTCWSKELWFFKHQFTWHVSNHQPLHQEGTFITAVLWLSCRLPGAFSLHWLEAQTRTPRAARPSGQATKDVVMVCSVRNRMLPHRPWKCGSLHWLILSPWLLSLGTTEEFLYLTKSGIKGICILGQGSSERLFKILLHWLHINIKTSVMMLGFGGV